MQCQSVQLRTVSVRVADRYIFHGPQVIQVLVIHQVVRFEPRWVLVSATCTLAVLAAVLSVGAYRHWHANQLAMRHAGPLPRTPLIPLLATATAVLSALAVLIIVMPK